MHPILFEVGGYTVYSYGFLIAIGAILGVFYLARRGRKEVGFTWDQANSLFLLIFMAALIGGKVFLFFEDPARYREDPSSLFTGRGFVFYGSFLFAIPTTLWYFRRNKLPVYPMLDIMAITTCIVHVFGRLGCFMAGCCHGTPTDSWLGVTYTDAACYADPMHTPLHPTQLYEAGFILMVMGFLRYRRDRKAFHGQLFLLYLLLYAAGRFSIEFYRGDSGRGFVFGDMISHGQLVALIILVIVSMIYASFLRRKPAISATLAGKADAQIVGRKKRG